jgi:hypothetical protein
VGSAICVWSKFFDNFPLFVKRSTIFKESSCKILKMYCRALNKSFPKMKLMSDVHLSNGKFRFRGFSTRQNDSNVKKLSKFWILEYSHFVLVPSGCAPWQCTLSLALIINVSCNSLVKGLSYCPARKGISIKTYCTCKFYIFNLAICLCFVTSLMCYTTYFVGFLKLPPYTQVGSDLTTYSSSLLGGSRDDTTRPRRPGVGL